MTAISHMFQLYFMVASLWNTLQHVLSATLLALQRSATNIIKNTNVLEEARIVQMLVLQLTILFLPCTSSKICVEVNPDRLDVNEKKGNGIVLYDTKALQQMLS